jgi:hypothetical protein
MVILLHRPDAFKRDDPRGGDADLILGKHRNGPTKSDTVAHQLHHPEPARPAQVTKWGRHICIAKTSSRPIARGVRRAMPRSAQPAPTRSRYAVRRRLKNGSVNDGG